MAGRNQRLLAPILFLTVALMAATQAQPQRPPAAAHYRALWIDAFHAGVQNPEETRRTVALARRYNINTLFVQVVRSSDAPFLVSKRNVKW